ncbi:MAG: hypothetical protein ACK5NE_08540 [Brachymonas sp.]
MTAHKHCELMKQYAEDAAETDKPHERWEVRHLSPNGGATGLWRQLLNDPTWYVGSEYRRKPRTLTYTVTIPEPLREPLKRGDDYYFAEPTHYRFYARASWYDDEIDRRRLQRGLIFAEPEDAAEAAKAMLPFKSEGA